MHADRARAVQTNAKRRAQNRICRSEFVAGCFLHEMNREVAGVEDQFVARCAIQVESDRAFQRFAVKMNIEIQMQMADANLIGA